MGWSNPNANSSGTRSEFSTTVVIVIVVPMGIDVPQPAAATEDCCRFAGGGCWLLSCLADQCSALGNKTGR